ncbi:ferrichrome ABC transporter [Kushneria pakistanensis]|uniref:Ferrichrome ABC transporter n=1 Tax=Kushneria pakistanensis TaxID=1508770 RepID=A0ABQ3FRN1_9GAMM|nr:ABC transporter ATP-binding protein [Kushneria pakistanensis]GHC34170.1 ferrichrome ABC transporter [Kushneria pakistanensis]
MVSLTLEQVTAHYGKREVLSSITTPTLSGGQVVALLGPNAAGKSTLFRRILGLLSGAGNVRITGARSERPVAYMPQETRIDAVLSVYESVLLARMQGRRLKVQPEDLAQVDAALDELNLQPLAKRDIGDLSGGQRQLVSAAQALVQAPDILLLDEPTSALDLHRQIGLLSVLRRLAEQRQMLIVVALHDLGHALRFADQAMVLAGGALKACGPTRAVVTSELLREVYQVEGRIENCSRGSPMLIVETAL